MTEEQWKSASEEERTAEFERCKDPVYVYNTYWRMPDGNPPNPITREQYDQMVARSRDFFFNGRTRRRYQPVSLEVEEAKAFNNWKVEQMKLNPATEAMLIWMKGEQDRLLDPAKLGIPEHINGEPQRVTLFYSERGMIGYRPDPKGQFLLTKGSNPFKDLL